MTRSAGGSIHGRGLWVRAPWLFCPRRRVYDHTTALRCVCRAPSRAGGGAGLQLRSVTFNDFRSFRRERSFTFVEPLTDGGRDLTAIAGTNGTGKTTILETVEALLAFATDPETPRELVREAWDSGFVALEVDLSAEDLRASEDEEARGGRLTIAVGRRDKAPDNVLNATSLFCRLVQRGTAGRPYERLKTPLALRLRKAVSAMQQGHAPLRGGLIYLPADRRLTPTEGGPIEPPPESRQWSFRLTPPLQWSGHLEQMLVWRNYLDLEHAARTHGQLAQFADELRRLLGPRRAIKVTEGRAFVTAGWANGAGLTDTGAWTPIARLPSGEQQILLLVGEVLRRARPGVILMIDEPEASLHPSLQRVLVSYLRRFASNWQAQVVMSTHSLEIVRTLAEPEQINLDQLEPTVAAIGGPTGGD